MPKTKPKNPAFLDTARAFYADAIDHHRKKDIVHAIEAWSEMDSGEQSYAVAHLLYLNVQAQAATLRVLTDVRDLLDEVADGVDQVIDASGADDPPERDAGDAPGSGADRAPDGAQVPPANTDQADAPTAEVA